MALSPLFVYGYFCLRIFRSFRAPERRHEIISSLNNNKIWGEMQEHFARNRFLILFLKNILTFVRKFDIF